MERGGGAPPLALRAILQPRVRVVDWAIHIAVSGWLPNALEASIYLIVNHPERCAFTLNPDPSVVDLRGAVAWRVWAGGGASFGWARATGHGGAGGMHFGGCRPPWDARVASDRPPLPHRCLL